MDNFNIKALINTIHEIETRCSEIELVLSVFQKLYEDNKAAIKELQSRIEAIEGKIEW